MTTKRYFLMMITLLLQTLFVSAAFSQSVEDGDRLFEEGDSLYVKAQSDDDLRKAVSKFQQALQIFERHNIPGKISEACNSLGIIYRRWGQYGEAKRYFEKSLEQCQKTSNRMGEAQALQNIAQTLSDLGLHDKALASAQKAVEISKQIKDAEGAALSQHIVGNVNYNRGDYLASVQALKDAQEFYERKADVSRRGRVLNDIGDAYTKAGRYKEALEALEMSHELLKESKDLIDEGAVLSNIGVVYENFGDFNRAADYYSRALSHTKKLKNPGAQGEILINLGNVKRQQGKSAAAIKYYQDCVAVYQTHNMPTNLPKDMIANIYLDNGEIRKAAPLVKEAGYNRSLARLHMAGDDYNKAREYYEKTARDAELKHNSSDLFIGYTGLGMASEALGQNEEAVDYFRKAIDATEESRVGLTQPGEKENFFSVRVGGFKRTDPYKGLARVLLKLNRKEEALKWSEYTKARLFSEALSKQSGNSIPSIPESVLLDDEKLNAEFAAVLTKRQEAYEKNNKDVVNTIDSEVKSARSRLDTHKNTLRARFPLFAATRYPEPMELKDIDLRADEWALVYDVSDAGVIIYLLNGRKLVQVFFNPISQKELASLVERYLEPLRINSEADFDKLKKFNLEAGRKISQTLLHDVLQYLPANVPVKIVPDDCLELMPFEMLVLNSKGAIKSDNGLPYISGAEFFADRNPVSYFQSLTALTLARTVKSRGASGDRLLVMADPVFDRKETQQERRSSLMVAMEDSDPACQTRPQRLERTRDLATDLASRFGVKVDIFQRLDASKAILLNKIAPHLDRYESIVFATHGYFSPGNPLIREPILLLTMLPKCTDGYLYQSEVLGLKMKANVVALTACQTGTGKFVPGEGVMSMGRAFQYAGASSVLMSLWNVHEKASVDLVGSFFRHVQAGKNRLEALKSAREDIQNKGYKHPYFWSAFILVGETK